MGRLLGFSRYVVLIAVIGLLLASIAVYVFGGIMTVSVIVEGYQEGFNAEGARAFSTELIELIDLFLLGTVMFMTSVGLYELFVDPEIKIPEWLSVGNVEELKFNLVVVISVMLMVLFLGAAAGDSESGLSAGLWRRHCAGDRGRERGAATLATCPSACDNPSP
jgi:uncharacterized membrane protein YqhA